MIQLKTVINWKGDRDGYHILFSLKKYIFLFFSIVQFSNSYHSCCYNLISTLEFYHRKIIGIKNDGLVYIENNLY